MQVLLQNCKKKITYIFKHMHKISEQIIQQIAKTRENYYQNFKPI